MAWHWLAIAPHTKVGEGRGCNPLWRAWVAIPHKQTGFALLRFTSGVVLD